MVILLLWCYNIFILWIILPLLVASQLELPTSSTEKVDLFCVLHLQLVEFVWKIVSSILGLSFYRGFLLLLLNTQVLWKICLAEETIKHVKYVDILNNFST